MATVATAARRGIFRIPSVFARRALRTHASFRADNEWENHARNIETSREWGSYSVGRDGWLRFRSGGAK